MRVTSGNVGRCVPAILSGFAGLLSACTASKAADPTDAGPPPQTDGDSQPQPDPEQDTGGPHARAVSPSLINVTWAPNSESDLAGYKVYRNRQPIPIAFLRGNTTTYADRSVLPATMYEYFVTAFDVAGNESSASPHIKATTPPEVMPPLSFALDVFPILQSQCSSCHAAFATLDTAFTRLTSMGSGPCAGQRLVIPGNALRSLLFQIVTGSHDCLQAPPFGPLPSPQANIIGAWINQGGVNDAGE